MGGSSSVRGDQTIYHTDNLCFDGTDRGTPMSADGQLWIGATASNRADNGGHVRLGNLTSTDSTVTITNGAGTIDLSTAAHDLHVARFIVASSTSGTGANFTNITAAIASAQGTGIPSTIFLQPGTYTENFTLPANINLAAFDCDAFTPNVTIVGKITCSDAGSRSISGIRLQTNSDFCLVVSGTLATSVYLVNCFINASNNTAISYTTNSANAMIECFCCQGNLATTGITYFSSSSAGYLALYKSFFNNTGSSTTASTSSSTGTIDIQETNFICPITTSVGSTFISARNSSFSLATNTTAITTGGTGGNNFSGCLFSSGTASCISIGAGTNIILERCSFTSTNTNVITGAGTVTYAALTFAGSGAITSTINTTTQTPFVTTNDALKVVTPGAYPYTTTSQDALIKVDTSSARTITPLASPVTGQKHIIKDTVGSAAANNITVTPSGKNIDGAASYVISSNYASITIVYNGSEWSII